jgi:hypothetical protein
MSVKKIIGIAILLLGTSIFVYNTGWCLFVSTFDSFKVGLWWWICIFPNVCLTIFGALYFLED